MIVPYRRLSARRGLADDTDLIEGVPDHLRGYMLQWVHYHVDYQDYDYPVQLINGVIADARIPAPVPGAGKAHDAIFEHCKTDDGLLDVVDALLNLTNGDVADVLRTQLERGGSAWTVAASGKELQARVDVTAHQSADRALTPTDAATVELAEAWSKIYGRSPDPSDGWDHAIKAVESVLAPIVIPANPKATLGTIIKAIEDKPQKWTLVVQSSEQTTGVETLAAMLRLMWPNPDRHAGANHRTPSQSEAAAVVQLAVVIVQWCRDGALT